MGIPKPKFKLKTVIFQRIGKVLLWTLVVFLILRGIVSIMQPDNMVQAEKMISDFVAQKSQQEKIEPEASSFAEGFALEYMTYDGRKYEDYEKRIRRYAPSYLGNFGMMISTDAKAEGLNAKTMGLTWRSDNQINVDVLVKVRYTTKQRIEDEISGETVVQEEITVQDTYIRVPVAEKDGLYMVEDYPAQIPAPDRADLEFDYYSGKQADSATANQIKSIMESFFKTYYAGGEGEIAYYLLDSTKSVKGLEGRYLFEKIDSSSVYTSETDPNGYFALVNFTIKDSINGQSLKQRFHVSIVKKEERYYIDKFDVRVGNLKISSSKE